MTFFLFISFAKYIVINISNIPLKIEFFFCKRTRKKERTYL